MSSDYTPQPKPAEVPSIGKNVGATQPTLKAKALAANKLEVRSNPCRLYSAVFANKSGGTLYYLLFDKAEAPVDGDIPDGISFPVADGQPGYFDYPGGKKFDNGCWVAASSTSASLTLAGASSDFEANFA